MEKVVKIMFDAAPNSVPVKATLTMEAPENLPDGITGYILVKIAGEVDWVAIPVEIPAEGTTGLVKTADGVDYVLTKTEAGYEWVAIPAVKHPVPSFPETDRGV